MFSQFDYDAALNRLPRWMLLWTCLAFPAVYWRLGMGFGAGFLAGAMLGYVNFLIIRKAVNRLVVLTGEGGEVKPPAGNGSGVWLFIQFAGLVLGAFGILAISGMNVTSALCGFLVCPAAAVTELLYELIKYGHP